jgi:hypothetical protein
VGTLVAPQSPDRPLKATVSAKGLAPPLASTGDTVAVARRMRAPAGMLCSGTTRSPWNGSPLPS